MSNVDSTYFKSEYLTEAKKPIGVSVQNIAQDAFNSIVRAIHNQTESINKLKSSFNDQTETAKKQDSVAAGVEKKKLVASMNAEKNNRAVNSALFRDVNKGFSLINSLKELIKKGLGELCDLIKNSFAKSLGKIDDLVRTLRKDRLSSAEIAQYSKATGDAMLAIQEKYKVSISRETLNSYITELQAKGKDVDTMLKNGAFEKYAAARFSGRDEDLARDATTISDKTIQKMLDTSFNKPVNLLHNEIMKSMTAAQITALGGIEKAEQYAMRQAVSLVENVGQAWSTESMAYFANIANQIDSGYLNNLNDSQLRDFLAAANVSSKEELTPESFGKVIAQAAQDAAKGNDNLQLVLQDLVKDNQQLAKDMRKAVESAKNGEALGISQEGMAAKIAERKADFTENGKLSQFTDNITAAFDSFTGGAFSSLAAELNEYLGSDGSLEGVVTTVLPFIAKLLLGIATSAIFKKGADFVKNIASGAADTATLFSTGASQAGGTAGKASKFMKSFGKAAGKVAVPLAIATTVFAGAAEMISESNKEYVATTSSLNSQAAKDKEKQLQNNIKATKVAGATTKTAITLGGIVAGAKIGAALGSVAPGVGNVIGGAVGAIAGLAVTPVVNAVSDAVETAKNLEISIGNIEDLSKQVEIYEKAVKDENDPKRRAEFQKSLNEAKIALNKNSEVLLAQLNKEFADKNTDFYTNSIPEVLSALKEEKNKVTQDKTNAQTQLDAIVKQLNDSTLSKSSRAAFEQEQKKWQDRLADADSALLKIRQTEALAVTENMGMKAGETISDYINRMSNDVIGDGIFDTTEARELKAALTEESLTQLKITETLDQLTNGVMHDTLDSLKKLNINNDVQMQQLVNFAKQRAVDLSLEGDQAEQLIEAIIQEAKGDIGVQKYKNLNANNVTITVDKAAANGAIVNQPTTMLAGEDGKEAILPLTKPEALHKVLMSLDNSDKKRILSALIDNPNLLTSTASISGSTLATLFSKIPGGVLNIFNRIKHFFTSDNSIANNSAILDSLPKNNVPGDDPATIEKILNYAGPARNLVYRLLLHGKNGKYKDAFKQRKKWYDEALANAANQEGRELIKGTYAERALDYGVSQLGKPYILRSLGKIGYVCNELVNACVKASGFDMKKFMVHSVKTTFANIQKGKYSDGNSYPDFRLRPDLTPETAIPGMVFFQDSRKNKEGGFQPGHIGLVYYGHQKLHSSGGSSNYTKEGFLQNWQTPCRGVTVTPFDSNSYMIGEFPGLFEQINGEWSAPNNNIPFGPQPINTNTNSTLAEQKRLALEAIDSVVSTADADVKAVAKQYAEQAAALLNGNNTKEVVESLTAIIKYLRDIANSPANKRNLMAASKPFTTAY